jgi:hypothetical protein
LFLIKKNYEWGGMQIIAYIREYKVINKIIDLVVFNDEKTMSGSHGVEIAEKLEKTSASS